MVCFSDDLWWRHQKHPTAQWKLEMHSRLITIKIPNVTIQTLVDDETQSSVNLGITGRDLGVATMSVAKTFECNVDDAANDQQ